MQKIKRNLIVFACLATLIGGLQLISHSVQGLVNKARPTDACIYDQVLDSILPVTRFLRYSPRFKQIVTGIDGVLIDFSIVFTGALMILIANTASAIPSLVLFFGIRSIALNIVTFPNSDEYIFESPGIPSYFVDYDKVNDLYFSGHTGTIFILLIDAVVHRQKIRSIFFSMFLSYTIFILIAQQIHYLNDIIIGMTTGALAWMIIYKNRYSLILNCQAVSCSVSAACYRLGSYLTCRQLEKDLSDLPEVVVVDNELSQLRNAVRTV